MKSHWLQIIFLQTPPTSFLLIQNTFLITPFSNNANLYSSLRMTNQFKTSSPPPPPPPPLQSTSLPMSKCFIRNINPTYFDYYLHMGETNDCRQKPCVLFLILHSLCFYRFTPVICFVCEHILHNYEFHTVLL